MSHSSVTSQQHHFAPTFQRSSSPVFFTGCVNSLQTPEQTPCFSTEKTKHKNISPQDFKNLETALNTLLANKPSALLGLKNKAGTCAETPMRPHLLPSPMISQSSRESCSNKGSRLFSDISTRAAFSLEIDSSEICISSSSPAIVKKKGPLLKLPFNTQSVRVGNEESNTVPKVNHFSSPLQMEHVEELNFHPYTNSQTQSSLSPKMPPRNLKRKHVSLDGNEKIKLPRKLFPSPRYHSSDISCGSDWKQVSSAIWRLYLDNRQTPEVYDKKMALRSQLHVMLLNTFPHCGLYVVGSSMSGLGANSSDMDMCLMLTHSEIDQEQEAATILHVVYETFTHYDFLINVELIHAKVPILRFKDSVSGIEVDLNINNAVGIRNTQLLNSYARIDDRVPPLVLLTKLWARYHGINDAKNHTLSSYSLVLMVIHFLQCGCSPPVLPCLQKLQPDKFQPYSDVRDLKLFEDLPPFQSENIQTLGELFLGFLGYFTNVFDFSSCVISVRTGGIIPKQTAMNLSSPKNKKGHWKCICIEEPFDLTNTARSVFSQSAFLYLVDVFVKSWHKLKDSGDLKSILDARSIVM